MSNQTDNFPGHIPGPIASTLYIEKLDNLPYSVSDTKDYYTTVSTEARDIKVPWKPKITVKNAMDVLKKAMEDDPGYAWAWHCNIAMAAYDEGLNHSNANKAASRFMSTTFGVETKYPE